MNAIVIGAGKLGYSVARILAKDYDVSVVEQQPDRAGILEETLDVRTITGDWSSPAVQAQVDFAGASIVVATTEVDEVNIVACMAAKAAGNAQTIARVRNPQYASPKWFGHAAISAIDLILSPERESAEEIFKLVSCPEAIGVQYFADGRLQMLEFRVPVGAPAVNRPLKKLDFGAALIAAIQRKQEIMIPRGDDVIKAEDRVFLLARTGEIRPAEALLGQEIRTVKRVTILGGGRIGEHLVRQFRESDIKVTLIERDLARCTHLSKVFSNVVVIHGNGADVELLREDGVAKTDMFIASTADDKLNLLACLVAKDLGAFRTVTTIRRLELLHLVERVGIDVAVNPQSISSAVIQRFLVGSSHLLDIHFMEGESLHALEYLVSPGCAVAGQQLQKASFPRGSLVGGLFRADGSVILPTGRDVIEPGDRAVVLALPEARSAVDKLFANAGRSRWLANFLQKGG